MKEVHRVYGIHAGVVLAYKKFPSQPVLHVVAGVLKGMLEVLLSGLPFIFLYNFCSNFLFLFLKCGSFLLYKTAFI